MDQHLSQDNKISMPQHGWCFYEAFDYKTFIVQCTNMVILLTITLILLRFIYKLVMVRKNMKFGETFTDIYLQIYIFILCWLVCTIIKVSINIWAYSQFISKGQFPDKLIIPQQNIINKQNIDSSFIILSTIFLCLDSLNTFFLTLLIIIIPYQWLLRMLLSIKQQQIQFLLRKKINYFFLILSIVKFYYKYLRNIIPILLSLQPLLLLAFNTGWTILPKIKQFIHNISRIVITQQTCLIIVFYLIGLYIVYSIKKKNLLRMSSNDFKAICIEYCLLLLTMLSRIIVNTFFQIFNKSQYQPNFYCYDLNQEHRKYSLVGLILASLIMHIFPICIVLFIYKPIIHQDIDIQLINDSQPCQQQVNQQKKQTIYNKNTMSNFSNIHHNNISSHNYHWNPCSQDFNREVYQPKSTLFHTKNFKSVQSSM